MLEYGELQNLEDYFKNLSERPEKAVYVYRLNGYHEKIEAFLQKYYDAARKNGVVIEGKIPNPDEKNLAYYEEMMGLDFQMNVGFLEMALARWLPRMNGCQRKEMAVCMYDTLDEMKKSGKNENMLKNAYIKFMCWLYYRFERIVNQLANQAVPKILYEGEVSSYELKMLTILAHTGCDILFLQYQGDASYQKLDAHSKYSKEYQMEGMQKFPQDFSLRNLQTKLLEAQNLERLYGRLPQKQAANNIWMEGEGLFELKKPPVSRGQDQSFFYNAFLRIYGVEDKVTYLNDLYQLQQELSKSGRKIVTVEHQIQPPAPEEIAKIQRGNYAGRDQMILHLSQNFRNISNQELQSLVQKAFVDCVLEAEKQIGNNLNKLINRAVYLLCWFNRYRSTLFADWSYPQINVFFYLGGCRNENESLFLKFLSRLPADVVILVPDKNQTCCLEDKFLYEIEYGQSLSVSHIPSEMSDLHMGTAAYHAERELDTLMYQDSGMYRNYQHEKAVAVPLQTMYEEIAILWKEDMKYRPNFSTENGVVRLPVLFAKVSGVKDGNVSAYWHNIRNLITEDTFIISKASYLNSTDENPMKLYAAEFYRNGRVQKEKIKAHKAYTYGHLREEIQNLILDKMELLIQQKTIKGTGENGTEYTIVSTILNLKPEIVRLLQRFDFTRQNPKLLYIHTKENMISLEDSILTAFLSLAGFDVVFFVPTGYQNVEKYFAKNIMDEHQIGTYLYDLKVPNFNTPDTHKPWHKKLFRKV